MIDIQKGAQIIIDLHLTMNPWLSRDIIKNLLKRQRHKKKVALSNRSEIITVLSIDEEKDSLMNNNIPKDVGRPKGTTYLAQVGRREKFEDMKNAIVDDWVDKSKSKGMKMKD